MGGLCCCRRYNDRRSERRSQAYRSETRDYRPSYERTWQPHRNTETSDSISDANIKDDKRSKNIDEILFQDYLYKVYKIDKKGIAAVIHRLTDEDSKERDTELDQIAIYLNDSSNQSNPSTSIRSDDDPSWQKLNLISHLQAQIAGENVVYLRQKTKEGPLEYCL